MIDQSKQYRTRDGREVRIYATDGGVPFPVHGAVLVDGYWSPESWTAGGWIDEHVQGSLENLIESDPHGILPRHRELLASVLDEHGSRDMAAGRFERNFAELPATIQIALIALARLESSLRSEVGE